MDNAPLGVQYYPKKNYELLLKTGYYFSLLHYLAEYEKRLLLFLGVYILPINKKRSYVVSISTWIFFCTHAEIVSNFDQKIIFLGLFRTHRELSFLGAHLAITD